MFSGRGSGRGSGTGGRRVETVANAEIGRPLVVVGVDGSDESVAALRWAAHYATGAGATVRAVMCWHYPTVAGSPPVGVAPAAMTEEVRQSLQETLDGAVGEVYPSPGADAIETKIMYGHPAQVLIEESEHADLLVVGSRGHGTFIGMYVGSVSTHCINQASCPVTVVRNY